MVKGRTKELCSNFISSELGPMSFLWNSFIEMIQILLDFIKSTRTCDWPLQMQQS